jgi:DNA-binding transcriptional ArsR family regulator
MSPIDKLGLGFNYFQKKVLKKICASQNSHLYLQPGCCILILFMETRRDIFHAIADPTRRAILTLLMLQALTPNAIADHFHTSRQAVSRHIQVLSECELLQQEVSGREIYYRLNLNKMKEVADWLAPFAKKWEDSFNRLDNILQELQSNKNEK